MGEGKVTLTCGHSNVPPVGVWEPEIDREGHKCRSYSTYCPTCAEDASLVMVNRIEALEAEVEMLRGAVAEAIYLLDLEAEDVLKGAGIYRIVSAHVAAGGVLPGDLKDALAQISTKKEKSDG